MQCIKESNVNILEQNRNFMPHLNLLKYFQVDWLITQEASTLKIYNIFNEKFQACNILLYEKLLDTCKGTI